MPFSARPLCWVGLAYLVLGLALWPVPLLNRLHAESNAVVAFVAFFGAGWSSLALFGAGRSFRWVLAWQEAALLIPWALLTLAVLWAPNCGYLQGLLFFALFPVVTVVLAVAVAYALAAMRLRRKKTLLTVLGLMVALLGPLYDLGLHPQFYTYNHVFGGVLGPIYDEVLAIRSGLFVFRGLTLLWALLAFLIGWQLRLPHPLPITRSSVLPLATVLALAYLFAGPLGFVTPAQKIERTLGGHIQTPHFDIFYDPTFLPEGDLHWLAEDHEYRYARLSEQLDEDVSGRIASYIYPDADTKALLTGARVTNVAPVWLRRPQSHVLLEHYTQVFPHELVHVFSREFGMPVVRASPAVGLVEGLAVALEPPDSGPSPHELVSAALGLQDTLGTSVAEDLAARLSPLGFWTGRGAVSYTTMGSFVRYLLDTYGSEPLKRVYATARFEAVYGKPADTLAAEWAAYVRALPIVDRSAADLVLRRFTLPSLLEQRCPHYVPRYRRHTIDALDALAAGDTTHALNALNDALADQPAYATALTAWAQIHLARAEPLPIIARLDTLDSSLQTPSLQFALGDAYIMAHQADRARAAYDAARQRLPSSAHEAHALLILRADLAHYPIHVRALTSALPPEVQATRLHELPSTTAAEIMRALRLAEAGHYEQAAAILRTTPAHAETPRSFELDRQRLAWQARFAARAGATDEAKILAERVAATYLAAGDPNAAASLRDLANKMRWRRAAEKPSSSR